MSAKFEYADKYVSTRDDIPAVPHYAIIEFKTILIPGDARSRECPGHGYPEREENILKYEAYLTEQKWKEQIEYRESKLFKKPYVAVVVSPATVLKTIETRVDVLLPKGAGA